METNGYMTTKEAADYLHISDRTLRNWCDQRKIRHERLSKRLFRFKKEWLDEYIQSIQIEPKKENEHND